MGGGHPDQGRRWRRLAGTQGRHQLAVVGTFERRPGDIFHPYPSHPIAFEFKQFGGLVGDVDEAVAVVRPAVVDPDDQRFAVAEIGHARIARHRKGRMGCGERRHVEHFAIGGQPAVEIIAVPGGHALFAVGGVFFRHVDPAGDGIRLADAVGAATFRNRFSESNHPRAARNAIFGIDPAGEFVR